MHFPIELNNFQFGYTCLALYFYLWNKRLACLPAPSPQNLAEICSFSSYCTSQRYQPMEQGQLKGGMIDILSRRMTYAEGKIGWIMYIERKKMLDSVESYVYSTLIELKNLNMILVWIVTENFWLLLILEDTLGLLYCLLQWPTNHTERQWRDRQVDRW